MALKPPNNSLPAPERPQFAVRLHPRHPGKQYRRAGVQFVSAVDVFFESVPEAILTDPWLMVTKVEPGKPPTYHAQDRRAKQAGQRL